MKPRSIVTIAVVLAGIVGGLLYGRYSKPTNPTAQRAAENSPEKNLENSTQVISSKSIVPQVIEVEKRPAVISMVSTVNAALDLHVSNAKLTPALATVFQKVFPVFEYKVVANWDSGTSEINGLVELLNQGVEPDEFETTWLNSWHIDNNDREMKSTWKFGDNRQREALVDHLWQEASKRKEGYRYARAALLLCAHERFTPLWTKACVFSRSKDFATRINVEPERARELARVLSETEYANTDFLSVIIGAEKAVNSATKGDSSVMLAALPHLIKSWSYAAGNPIDDVTVIRYTWRLYVFARRQSFTRVTEQIDAIVAAFARSTQNDEIRRLLEEFRKTAGFN